MKRLLAASLVIIAALFASTSRAEAATLTVIGGAETVFFNPLPGCTTCSATATFDLTAAGTLAISLTNTSTDGVSGQNLITALGFNTTPDITVNSATVPAGWSVSNSNAVLQLEVLGSTVSGVNNALDGGQTINFTIFFSPSLTSLTLDESAIHIQALVGGASIKITGEGDGGSSEEGDGGGSSPEPASLVLFGLALSAVGMRMRRARS